MDLAQRTFDTMCSVLSENGLTYKKAEGMTALLDFGYEDSIHIELTASVDPDRSLILILGKLPFTVPDDKRIDFCIALSLLNCRFVCGCFDLDASTGEVRFRLSNSFKDSKLGENVYINIVLRAYNSLCRYAKRLMMLSEGTMTLEQFISWEND